MQATTPRYSDVWPVPCFYFFKPAVACRRHYSQSAMAAVSAIAAARGLLARGFRVPARAYHRRRDAMTSLLTLSEESVKGAGSERVIYRLGRRDQGLLGPLVNVRVPGGDMVPPQVVRCLARMSFLCGTGTCTNDCMPFFGLVVAALAAVAAAVRCCCSRYLLPCHTHTCAHGHRRPATQQSDRPCLSTAGSTSWWTTQRSRPSWT